MYLTQLQLNYLFQSATQVRVLRDGAEMGRSLGHEILVKANVGTDVLATLKEALRVNLLPSLFRCMCSGNYAIEFWNENSLLTTIAFHHGSSLRHPFWPLEGRLKNPGMFEDWLTEHAGQA